MRRKILAGGMTLVMVGVLLGACGVPQEDLDAAETQLSSVQSELATAKSALSTAQSSLSTAQGELTTATAERNQALADLDTAETELFFAESSESSARSDLSAANAELTSVKADLAAALAAVPEEPPDGEEPPAEEAAVALSFEAQTYTDEDYGFSIQFPSDWSVSPFPDGYLIQLLSPPMVEWIELYIEVPEGTLAEDLAAYENYTDAFSIVEEKETTLLADGSTTTGVWFKYSSGGYPVTVFGLRVDLGDGNAVRISVGVTDAYGTLDEALFEEIASTLRIE